MNILNVKCSIIRGGTTKGVFIERSELPTDIDLRDKAILALFGSPDTRQINGLGGGDPLTSKVVLANASPDDDIDVDYESGEVGIDNGIINYGTMCGNLAAGVGLHAISMGWVKIESPFTEVKIRNINTNKRISAIVSTANNSVPLVPCMNIDCVPGYGAEIDLKFSDPAGAITGYLLPTGNPADTFTLKEKKYTCSIVDCGVLYVFFESSTFSLTGCETPEDLDQLFDFRETIEDLRYYLADYINTFKDNNITKEKIKIAIYSFKDIKNKNGNVSLVARVINTYKTHKAYPVTGALCISAATLIEGSLLYKQSDTNMNCVTIDHPSGVIISKSSVKNVNGNVQVESSSLKRSSRILIQGISETYF